MSKKKQEEPEKKYTIVYSLGIGETGEELLQEMEVDYWMEDMLAGGSVIFAGNIDTNRSVTLPFTAFRAIYQNFNVKEDIEKFAQFNEKMKRRQELIRTQNHREKELDKDVT